MDSIKRWHTKDQKKDKPTVKKDTNEQPVHVNSTTTTNQQVSADFNNAVTINNMTQIVTQDTSTCHISHSDYSSSSYDSSSSCSSSDSGSF